jgi:hypothetical protein
VREGPNDQARDDHHTMGAPNRRDNSRVTVNPKQIETMHLYPGNPIRFRLDWSPLIVNGQMVFWIQVEDRQIDVPIDRHRLDSAEQQQLDEFVQRQQNHTLSREEVAHGIGWLIDKMLQQQLSGLSKIGRKAKTWEILGVEDPPSFKEPYFIRAGHTLLSCSRSEKLFEDSQKRPHFEKIFLSWRRAIYKINFGVPLPRNLRVHSLVEAEELELFSYALQFEPDRTRVYQIFAPIMARYDDNKIFSRWKNQIIKHREKPNTARLDLDYWLVCGWIHGFMWGYSNLDRVQILIRMAGMSPRTEKRELTPELIKMTARRRGLLGWSDFPEAYPRAPWTLDLSDRP